jgi:endoglucanase
LYSDRLLTADAPRSDRGAWANTFQALLLAVVATIVPVLRYLQGAPFPLRQDDPVAEALIAKLTLQGHPLSAARLQAAMAEGWDEARIQAAFAPAADWAARYRKPVIVDEFGVLGCYAGMGDRSRWLRAVRIVAEQNCFGWTHWEFAQRLGFLNASGTEIEPDLAEALLGKSGE